MCGIPTSEILEAIQWLLIGYTLFSIGKLWESLHK